MTVSVVFQPCCTCYICSSRTSCDVFVFLANKTIMATMMIDVLMSQWCVLIATATEFGEITKHKGRYAVQGHSRWPILVPIQSSCDFLLVINTMLCHTAVTIIVTTVTALPPLLLLLFVVFVVVVGSCGCGVDVVVVVVVTTTNTMIIIIINVVVTRLLCCDLHRSENFTLSTQTSASLTESDATATTDHRQTTTNSMWPTSRPSVQQAASTLSIEEGNNTTSTTTSSQFYFNPYFLPDKDRLDNDDIAFYVDSMIGEADNSTRRYDNDYYDDDELRARDLERIVIESSTTSRENSMTLSTPPDTLSIQLPSYSRRAETTVAVGTEPQHQPSSVSSSSPSTTTTTTNSSVVGTDWWRQFPFLGSVSTTSMTTSSENTLIATTTAAAADDDDDDDDTSSSTTLRSTIYRHCSRRTLTLLLLLWQQVYLFEVYQYSADQFQMIYRISVRLWVQLLLIPMRYLHLPLWGLP